jgi:hypothetical protein
MRVFFRQSAPLFTLTAFILTATNAQALSLNDAFDALQKSKENFVNTGAVCEHVAKLELEQEFPPSRYQIEIGISYLTADQVVGELDVVVIEKSTGQVPVVGEVKCWKNLDSGLDKAKEQEVRFLETLDQNRAHPEKTALSFTRFTDSGESAVPVKPESFRRNPDHLSIAQKGARAVGYDRELDMTLEELMELRKKLMGRKK